MTFQNSPYSGAVQVIPFVGSASAIFSEDVFKSDAEAISVTGDSSGITGSATIAGCTFDTNGSGVVVNPYGSSTIYGSTFSNNTVAVNVSGGSAFVGTNLASNSIYSTSGTPSGEGVLVTAGTVTVQGDSIYNLSTGIEIGGSSVTATIEGNSFEQNLSEYNSTDLQLDSTATGTTTLAGNDFQGATYIDNMSAENLNTYSGVYNGKHNTFDGLNGSPRH